MTKPENPTHNEPLAFMDYLRATPAVASEYAELKRDLATLYPDDRANYTAEKSEFVESTLEDSLDE